MRSLDQEVTDGPTHDGTLREGPRLTHRPKRRNDWQLPLFLWSCSAALYGAGRELGETGGVDL
jgi:hypothetical protein